MRTEYSIAVLVLAFMLLPTLGAAAEWDNPNAWVAPSNVSDGSNVVAVMQVLNDVGNPVVPGDCDTLNTRYRYPPNSADPGGMTYINGSNGFYFSDIQVGSESSSLTLEAEGSGCPDFNDGTSSLTFGNFSTAGNLSTSIMNATDRFLEGETYSIWLDVSNNGNFVSQVDNTWFLYNWTGNLIDSGSTSQVGDHYVADISMPLTGKENYFLAFKSDKPTSNISNPFGGDSKAITVEKELEASVDTIDVHNRCNGNASICQKGAVVQVRFRETRNHAETVSGRVQGNGKNFTQLNFTRTSPDLWKANFTIPVDFDTSNYGKELEIITSGSSDLSSVTESSTVTVRPFAIKRGIIQTYAFQGSSMEIVFGPEYPFTGIPLSRDQMKRVYLEIEYPDGNVENIWNNVKEVPDENYDTDLNKYRYLWDVPEDAPTGTYNFEVRLTDQFNEERSELFNFDVKSRSLEPTDVVVNKIPSYLTDIDSKTEMEKTFESRGTVSGEVLLTNNGSETATVDVSFSGDIKNLTSAKVVRSDGSLANPPFDIQEGQTRPVRLSFDLQKFRGYQGIVRFDVQGDTLQYDRSITVDYTVENPCDVTATDFCLLSGEIDKTYTRQGQFEPNVSVRNTGNSSVSLSVSAEGNITDIASLTKESLDLQPGDNRVVSLSLSASNDLNGMYSGKLVFENGAGDTAELPVDIEIDVPQGSIDLSINGSTDLGEVLQGDSKSFSISIENTGSIPLDNIVISSSDLKIDKTLEAAGQPITLDSGESVSADIDLATGSISPGEYTGEGNKAVISVEAGSGARDTSKISIVVHKDIEGDISSLKQKISEFENEVNSLEGRISGDKMRVLRDNLNSMQSSIDEAETAWGQGNYKKAQQAFSQAEDTSSKLRNEIGRAKESAAPVEEEGGGISIWLIVVPLIIVVLIILVVYLSIVPDEEVEKEEPEYGPPI